MRRLPIFSYKMPILQSHFCKSGCKLPEAVSLLRAAAVHDTAAVRVRVVCRLVAHQQEKRAKERPKKRKAEVLRLVKGVTDKKSRATVFREEDKFERAMEARSKAEMLLPEEAGFMEAEGIERTFRFKQDAITAAVDVAAAQQAFNLSLPTHGPYKCKHTRNGRCVSSRRASCGVRCSRAGASVTVLYSPRRCCWCCWPRRVADSTHRVCRRHVTALYHTGCVCVRAACVCVRARRHMLLLGRKGHIALVDVLRKSLVSEHFVGESTRDGVFLHNMTMYAAAQKKYVYIYDAKGTEIHCLKSHIQPQALDFLPYHFLLASVGSTGYLKYQVWWRDVWCC